MGTAQPIRLFLVDDLARVRLALRSLLQCEPEFEIVGEAGDGESALQQLSSQPVDMVLMDLMLPGITGIEAISTLRRRGDRVPVVCLTLHGDMRAEAEAAGATLFLEKGIAPDQLIEALRGVAKAA